MLHLHVRPYSDVTIQPCQGSQMSCRTESDHIGRQWKCLYSLFLLLYRRNINPIWQCIWIFTIRLCYQTIVACFRCNITITDIICFHLTCVNITFEMTCPLLQSDKKNPSWVVCISGVKATEVEGRPTIKGPSTMDQFSMLGMLWYINKSIRTDNVILCFAVKRSLYSGLLVCFKYHRSIACVSKEFRHLSLPVMRTIQRNKK